MEATKAPPESPHDLRARGQRLWREITREFELRFDELTQLASACRLGDTIARQEAELQTAPTTVTGSMGQIRPHPLFAEIRANYAAQARILRALGLSDATDEGGTARSQAGRRLARLRWG